MNATLVIHDTNKFEDDVWQTSGDDFTARDWKEALENFWENAQEIYDWIDTLDDHNGDFNLYILGDLINMIQSIDLKVEGENA